jgi:tRNA(adenine34) deaminase
MTISFYFCPILIDMTQQEKDERYMRVSLEEAKKALEKNEVPIGAVVVCNDIIISRAHNLTETLNDPTAHAEMQAITAAANYLGGKYLTGCKLYVTVEPCAMCAGALNWAQITEMIYGADDEKKGYTGISSALLHTKTIVRKGILEKECREILVNFFRQKR